MEEGVYRVLFYKEGQSANPGSEVARIDYLAFSNDNEGNGIGLGVVPKDLEGRQFEIINLERAVEYFQTGHFVRVNLSSPLEEADKDVVAGLISLYDSEVLNYLLNKGGGTVTHAKARSVTVKRIRSLDSLCQRFAFRN